MARADCRNARRRCAAEGALTGGRGRVTGWATAGLALLILLAAVLPGCDQASLASGPAPLVTLPLTLTWLARIVEVHLGVVDGMADLPFSEVSAALGIQ